MKHFLLLASFGMLVACDFSGTSSNPIADSPSTPPPTTNTGSREAIDSSRITYRGVVIDPVTDSGSVIYVPYSDDLKSEFRMKGDSLRVRIVADTIGTYLLTLESRSGVSQEFARLVSVAGTSAVPETLSWRGAMPADRRPTKLVFGIGQPDGTMSSYPVTLTDSGFHPTLSEGTGRIVALRGVRYHDDYQTTSIYRSYDGTNWKSGRSAGRSDTAFVCLAGDGNARIFSFLDLRNMSASSTSGKMSTSDNLGMLIEVGPILERDGREIASDFAIIPDDPSRPQGDSLHYRIAGFQGSGGLFPEQIYISRDGDTWSPYSHTHNPRGRLALNPLGAEAAYFKVTLEVEGDTLTSNVVRVTAKPMDLRVKKYSPSSVSLLWTYYVDDSVDVYAGPSCQELSLVKSLRSGLSIILPQDNNTTACYQIRAEVSTKSALETTPDLPDSTYVFQSDTVKFMLN